MRRSRAFQLAQRNVARARSRGREPADADTSAETLPDPDTSATVAADDEHLRSALKEAGCGARAGIAEAARLRARVQLLEDVVEKQRASLAAPAS